MSSACKRQVIVLMIENQISHANKHVFLDVGIELSVHLSQDIRWRRVASRFRAQDAATDRYDKRCGDAFTGHVCNRYTEPFFIDLNVIEIIAAHLAGGHIKAADLKSIDGRRFRWKQDPLNIPRDFQIVVESL